jgi:hypothetical protein
LPVEKQAKALIENGNAEFESLFLKNAVFDHFLSNFIVRG